MLLTPGGAGRTACPRHGGAAWSAWTSDGERARGGARTRPRDAASARRTSPTSSTPPARPAGPRACWSSTAGSSTSLRWHARATTSGPGTGPRWSRAPSLRRLRLGVCGRCLDGGAQPARARRGGALRPRPARVPGSREAGITHAFLADAARGGRARASRGRSTARPALAAHGEATGCTGGGRGAAVPRLVNDYGPTEARSSRRATGVAPGGEQDPARSAARSPTRGPTCSTRRCEPVPVGVPGELYIGGDGSGARLPGPPGADRRALRAGPVRRPSPARGCTAPATWCATAPTGSLEFLGRDRPPGQDPRLPHRAGRDRGASLEPAPAVERGGGGGARGRAGRASGWWPTCVRARARRVRDAELRAHLRPRAARVHGARRRSWSLEALPLTPERQGGPPGAARAGRRPARRRRTSAPRDAAEEMLARIWARGAAPSSASASTTTSSSWAATRS